MTPESGLGGFGSGMFSGCCLLIVLENIFSNILDCSRGLDESFSSGNICSGLISVAVKENAESVSKISIRAMVKNLLFTNEPSMNTN